MSTGLHRNLVVGENHIVHSLEYADAAARANAVGLGAADVGRIAKQTDDVTFWLLTGHAPVSWLPLGMRAPYGTEFPLSAETGDLFWRTDLGALFIWGGSEWKSVGGPIGNIVTVALDGTGDYNSIQAAIDAVAPSASEGAPWLVSVAPGTFIENVLLADYVTVKGVGWDTVLEGHVDATDLEYGDIGQIRIIATNEPALTVNCPGGECDATGAYLQSVWNASADPGIVRCTLRVDAGLVYLYRLTECIITVTDTVNDAPGTIQALYYVTGADAVDLQVTAAFQEMTTVNPGNQVVVLYSDNTNAATKGLIDGDSSAIIDLTGAVVPTNSVHAAFLAGGNGTLRILAGMTTTVKAPNSSSVVLHAACCQGSVDAGYVEVVEAIFLKEGVSDANTYLGSATTAKDHVSLIACSFCMDSDVLPERNTVGGALGAFAWLVYNTGGSTGMSGPLNGIRRYPPSATPPATPSDGDRYWNTVEHEEMYYNGATAAWRRMALPSITQSLTVGKGGDVDYNTIHDAVDAAIAGGAGAATPWVIAVYPGTYTEPPMVVVPGITITTAFPHRVDTATVVAQNPNADLFTLIGGLVEGLSITGVWGADKACFRCDTPYSFAGLHSVAIRGCSTGIYVAAGATVINTDNAFALDSAFQNITAFAIVTGAGSYLALNGALFNCSPLLLPYYAPPFVTPAINPVQSCVRVLDGARCSVLNALVSVAYQDDTADVFFVDEGSILDLTTSTFFGCGNVIHIGSNGAYSVATTNACGFSANRRNILNESMTGLVYANHSTDVPNDQTVTPAYLSGMVQYRYDRLIRMVGRLYYTYANTNKDLNLADFYRDLGGTFLCDGGEVTAGTGLHVEVAEGEGFVRRDGAEDDLFSVEWEAPAAPIDLTPSTTNYISYDHTSGAVVASETPPGTAQIGLAVVVTSGAGIRYLHQVRKYVPALTGALYDYLLSTRKFALNAGLGGAEGSTVRKLDVASGSYYLGLDLISFGGADDATFSYFYGGGATEVAAQTELDITQYDNAGALANLQAGHFRTDTIVLTSDGRISVIYGTADFATALEAEAAPHAVIPAFMSPSGFLIAKVIVEQAVGIHSFVDLRPQPGTSSGGGGGGAGVSDHSLLSNLNADDHPQYLLASGGRAMSGDLDMGGQDITNVALVAGLDIAAHEARHVPGGADALPVDVPVALLVGAPAGGSVAKFARSDHQHGVASATPESVGTANDEGDSTSVARADHVHSHGAQPLGNGTGHAAATGTYAGFMPAAAVTRLAAVADPMTNDAPASVGTANAAGSASTPAHRDHVHDHGAQTNPAHHAVATNNANGFMSAADKVKLSGYPSAPYATQQVARAWSPPLTIQSLTDVVVTDMSFTSAAGGNYLVTFRAYWNGASQNAVAWFSIYVNGVQVAASVNAQHVVGRDRPMNLCLSFYVSGVSAGQVIDVRCHSGTSANIDINTANLIIQQTP